VVSRDSLLMAGPAAQRNIAARPQAGKRNANDRFTRGQYTVGVRHLLILLLLAGCEAFPTPIVPVAAAVSIGSIAVIQRSPFDALYSMLSGRDCSIVRMDQGKSYCKPVEPPPEPPPYCTRSLGVADCWRDPAHFPNLAPPLADGPQTLTPVQEVNRTSNWPHL
jgi:hypothetical protein